MDSDKKPIVEQRIKPTVIRRRAKEEPVAKPPVPVKAEALSQPSKPEKPAAPVFIETEVAPPIIHLTAKEKEEKAKKAAKKKKSKAELELEDIQRAGGLKQFAQQTLGSEEETEPAEKTFAPSVERVFEPTHVGSGRRKKPIRREFKQTQITETNVAKKVIRIQNAITISELSQSMGIKSSELIKKLMGLGMMATTNQNLDVDTATLLATDYGFEVLHTAFKEEEVLKATAKETEDTDMQWRAPVVTVMGHVDHGKTSLLDAIRKTKVTEKEAGGITQHIGAYEVTVAETQPSSRGPKDRGISEEILRSAQDDRAIYRTITFIDTPGHQAFTQMRARGAQVTDIVVLVVAADDGLMPQTIEAINHAKAANVSIIVAINKIDKPQADPEKVKRQLTEHGLVAEDWGGDIVCVPTSAKTGQGLDHLLEMILLTAEVKELKANVSGRAKGVVIEARLDKGRGPVATALIQSGILNVGDFVVAGLTYGRARAMLQADGSSVEKAGPSKPVGLIGLNAVPEAGEELFVVEDERDAKRIVETRQAKKRSSELSKSAKFSLESLQEQISKGETHELPLVIKGDVAGSVEALTEALTGMSNNQVTVKTLHSGIGGITENDVMLARASRAVIIGFNVAPEGKARALAEQEGIEIRLHNIIYEVMDDIKNAMEGLLAPKITEKFLGRANVKQVFKITKVGTIAGCMVSDGIIRRNCQLRLIRDGQIIYQGKPASLKRFKDDAREVTAGMDCGIAIENFNDIKEGDVLEAFIMEETAQKLL
ncbi:MAG: translation initiation factor IF-2 [Deltaproteobacteria bacterium]|nr:translation initiation factor IF-2 [Deltaproteobacteria bacterium]